MLGGIDRPASTTGVMFALATGCAWAGVAYAGRSVGRRTRRVDGLALAIPFACFVTLPLGIGHLDAIDPRALGLGLARIEPRLVAIIYSVDPAIAGLVGLVALGQHMSLRELIGMAAVVAASAGATVSTRPT